MIVRRRRATPLWRQSNASCWFVLGAAVLMMLQLWVDVWLHGQNSSFFQSSPPPVDTHLPVIKYTKANEDHRNPVDETIATLRNEEEEDHIPSHAITASSSKGHRQASLTKIITGVANTDDNLSTSKVLATTDEDHEMSDKNHQFGRSSPATSSKPFAYVFVLERNSHESPAGFLYNLLVAVRLLEQLGSTADYVLSIPRNNCSSNSNSSTAGDHTTSFPSANEEHWLTLMNVQIRHYDPICNISSALDKLIATVSMVDYRRVLYVDARSILPVRNLDYLFHLSSSTSDAASSNSPQRQAPILEENIIIATNHAPAYAGLFLIAPGNSDRLLDLLIFLQQNNHHDAAVWDPLTGWGHKIQSPDYWASRTDQGQYWTFPMASSDYGLLYHWTKYEQKSVSIIFGNTVENWAANANGTMTKVETLDRPFDDYSKPGKMTSVLLCQRLLCDVVQYESKQDQPWRRAPTKAQLELPKRPRTSDPKQLWWLTMRRLNDDLQMGLDIENWTPPIDPNVAKTEQQHSLDRTAKNSTYAYAFVIGGCDPATQGYKGFVYNILVAVRVLRQQGSVADVVAFFQMKHDSHAEELPAEDLRLLNALQVKIYYIPKSPAESFYDTVMNKFRVLSLTQYRRVILMDGDVVPVRNLDYLFELSDPSFRSPYKEHTFKDRVSGETKPLVLQENLIVAGKMEPANAGFFMVRPKKGDYEHIQDIIETRARTAAETLAHKKAPFDEIKGWGHEIVPPDRWTTRSTKHSGTNWTFHFAYSDQGLLYHWTKYVKKNVSIVFTDYVENWAALPNGTVALQDTLHRPFGGISVPGPLYSSVACSRFMCDFYHYSGKGKPWLHPPKPEYLVPIPKGTMVEEPSRLWWSTLKELDAELHIGINFTNWEGARPDLGMWANRQELTKHVHHVHANAKEAE